LALVSLLALNGFLQAADPALQALREGGRWKQLRAQVEPRFQENPNDPQILYWMSEVKAAFADFQGAYDLARKAATAAPGDADCQRALARASGEMAQRAGLFKQMSYARECKKAGESALKLNPQDLDNVEFMANFYALAPSIVGGNDQMAEELRKRATELDPVRGAILEANAAMKKNDRGRAEAILTQAIASNPNSYSAHISLANFCLDPNNLKAWEAVKYARIAQSLDPNRIDPFTVQARAFAELEQWPELEATLIQAEKNVPDNLYPYYATGRALLLKSQKLTKAEQCFKKYLTQEPEGGAPDHAAAQRCLSLVYEKRVRTGEMGSMDI
jgi:tetratricopeptide (TPR) repeat protein